MSHPMYAAPKPVSTQQVPHTAYQVDYVAQNCGRIVSASKRRIRFKFGYTNTEVLNSGKTGRECRGSEHEVNITWSLSSGKQAIAFDQHEVFFDVGDSTQTKLTHTWKDQLGHTIQVKAHAANMSSKANPDPEWKQYDLLVDGVSYFNMPKIFEIGIFPSADALAARTGPLAFRKVNPEEANVPLAFRNKDFKPTQSQRATQQYKNQSYNMNSMESILPPVYHIQQPVKQPQPEPVPEVMDLLSFDDFDTPAPTVAAPTQHAAPVQAHYGMPAQPMTQAPAQAPVQAPGQANYVPVDAPTQANWYAPAQTVPAPAPVLADVAPAQFQQNYAAPTSSPFGMSPAQQQSNSNTVSPNTSPGGAENNYMTSSQGSSSFHAPSASNFAESNPFGASSPAPITPPETTTALVPAQPAPTMNNLVDMDNLFGTTTAPVTKQSVDTKMQEANAHKSLGQLHGSINANANQKKPVMNPFNAAPAYQQQQQGTYNAFAPQQTQPQYNNYTFQQQYAQPGFGSQ